MMMFGGMPARARQFQESVDPGVIPIYQVTRGVVSHGGEHEVAEGSFASGMSWLSLGSGSPLVVLPGLAADHRPPVGAGRWAQLRQMKSFAGRHRVFWVNRRPGLASTTTIGQMANDYAVALRCAFDGPVDVLGISTGGSIALQLAADHPELIRRLVLVSAAYRLGNRGLAGQRTAADALREDRSRPALAAIMTMLADRRGARWVLGAVGWLLGPVLLPRGDFGDMLATIDAEERFDLAERLVEITAPVLIIAGDRDAVYDEGLFGRTAALLPRGTLALYHGRGHLGTQFSRRLGPDVRRFLDR